jgi:CRISPR-associated protein Csb2
MLTLGIRYLCETVVAGELADRARVEWPPHPARIFMAMAAAHFQTGDALEEREALLWLEQQDPPLITAGHTLPRQSVTSYVPVNDDAGDKKTPIASAPGFTRLRQPRTFAKAWLEDDTVFLHWPALDAGQHLPALRNLCAKVTRIGHSSSLVQMWATDEVAPAPTWEPHAKGKLELRVLGAGSLAGLEERFNREGVTECHDLEDRAVNDDLPKNERDAAKALLKQRFPNGAPARLRPEMNLSQAYRRVGEATPSRAPGTVFDPRLIMVSLKRKDGPFRQLGLAATLDITQRCRNALLELLDGVDAEALTGHHPITKARSERPHLAILPLPFVGREHATGGILGLGFALPESITPTERQHFNKALANLCKNDLLLDQKGRWELLPPDDRDTFRSTQWIGEPKGADLWATVTPFVYDRHAKAKDKAAYQEELAEGIRAAWQNVKHQDNPATLVEVIITPVSAHLGALPAHAYPRLRRKDGSERRHCHAILRFDQPISGPLILGAGRYRGYGLCRPM